MVTLAAPKRSNLLSSVSEPHPASQKSKNKREGVCNVEMKVQGTQCKGGRGEWPNSMPQVSPSLPSEMDENQSVYYKTLTLLHRFL